MYKGLSRSEQIKSLPILKEVGAEKNLPNKAKAKYKVNMKEVLHYSKVWGVRRRKGCVLDE